MEAQVVGLDQGSEVEAVVVGLDQEVLALAVVVGLDQGAEVEAVVVGLDEEVLALAVVVVVGAMDRMAELAAVMESGMALAAGVEAAKEVWVTDE